MSLLEFRWSLAMTASQLPPGLLLRLLGLTQASSVIPVVRLIEAALGMVTIELVAPVNFSAEPYLPATQVALATVPVFPFPDESFAVVPLPSSRE